MGTNSREMSLEGEESKRKFSVQGIRELIFSIVYSVSFGTSIH